MSSRLFATLKGSRGSSAAGFLAVFTLQNLQPRVQVSPITMIVAVPPPQHSPKFGQCASSQTVASLRSRIISLIWRYFSPLGACTFSQGGLGEGLRTRLSVMQTAYHLG